MCMSVQWSMSKKLLKQFLALFIDLLRCEECILRFFSTLFIFVRLKESRIKYIQRSNKRQTYNRWQLKGFSKLSPPPPPFRLTYIETNQVFVF